MFHCWLKKVAPRKQLDSQKPPDYCCRISHFANETADLVTDCFDFEIEISFLSNDNDRNAEVSNIIRSNNVWYLPISEQPCFQPCLRVGFLRVVWSSESGSVHLQMHLSHRCTWLGAPSETNWKLHTFAKSKQNLYSNNLLQTFRNTESKSWIHQSICFCIEWFTKGLHYLAQSGPEQVQWETPGQHL